MWQQEGARGRRGNGARVQQEGITTVVVVVEGWGGGQGGGAGSRKAGTRGCVVAAGTQGVAGWYVVVRTAFHRY